MCAASTLSYFLTTSAKLINSFKWANEEGAYARPHNHRVNKKMLNKMLNKMLTIDY
jgi:hypothetical protein